MISYNSEKKYFQIETKNTTYAFGFLTDFAPVNIYYGKKIKDISRFPVELHYGSGRGNSAIEPGLEGNGQMDTHVMEFSTFGSADLRLPSLHLQYADGTTASRFTYKSHKIYAGKPKLEGLPATYVENDSEADTLELTLYDELKDVSVTLIYTAFYELDAIARSMRVENCSEDTVLIKGIMSATVDFPSMGADYDFIHLPGAWARERSVERRPLLTGNQEVYSRRGSSSHHHNPFFAVAERDATELTGDVYGFNLIYSGNFSAGVEVDVYNIARAYIGINPFDFNWRLEKGDSFQSPEAVMVYSDAGLSGMSRIYHKLYRTRLARGIFRDKERYALINNWEGTYFSFTEEKILDIAKKGAEIGLDLMVLDDGWFGKRDDSKSSLGDWVVYKDKLPNGLDGLANNINKLGMKFGLWFEPEMVSPDSDLFRAHPDWAIHIDGRPASLSRSQLTLDLSRDDVCDYIIDAISNILSSANIEYVKWDMNRTFSEMASSKLPPERMGEFCHRYMLGLYRVLETLTTRFSNVLWEGCASGGGRFDGGILYYMPQSWLSDCSDAGERINIQYGSSLCYPFSSMGSHISAVPNHQLKRVTSLRTRGYMAMMGQFGYELDMTQMEQEEIEFAKEQVKFYKEYGEVFHKGDLYRLVSPFEKNNMAMEFVSEDKNTVIVVYSTRIGMPNGFIEKVKLAGLDPDAKYLEIDIGDPKGCPGVVFGGDELMNRGLKFAVWGDFAAVMRIFKKQ